MNNENKDFNFSSNNDGFDLTENLFGDDDFKISNRNKLDNLADIDSSEGALDDSMLSDDFVIGKDFFIDKSVDEEIGIEEPKEAHKKKRKKKITAEQGCIMAVIWMAAILIISITAAYIILYFGMDYLGVSLDTDSAEDNIEVVVDEGTSAKEIAAMLEEKGVIDSELFFRFYASQGGYAAKFRDGIYYFSKQDSYSDIVDKLIKQGTQAESVKVTIPEGWTIDKIAKRLAENKVCTESQFKQAVNEATYKKYNYDFMKDIKTEADGVHYRLEGYLFPDTYYFYQTNNKAGAEQAIKKMLDNFDKKIEPSMRIRAKDRGVSLHDVITMASIIEMESSVASYEVKQKVSAVFWNRLNDWGEDAKLQSDPTQNYPYNTEKYDTYKISGLAPGAYCAPSIDAIKAALYPDEDCEKYYFVTDKNMKFYFSSTNSEHNATINELKGKGLWVTKK